MSSSRPTVAVLGASGFVGSHVARALEARGAIVRPITSPRINNQTDQSKIIAQLAEASEQCVAIVNAAGIAEATSSSDRARWANSALPPLIAAAANEHGIRFIHVSSASVQGRRNALDSSPERAPFSFYSMTKAQAELTLLKALGKIVIYRPPGVHAPSRGVTQAIARLARSPLSSVAAPGHLPSPQAWAPNVGDAVAFLALTQNSPPIIVHHPWEGVTTTSLLQQLGKREPLVLPRWLASAAVTTLFFGSHIAPALSGHARRLEVMWFGQKQSESWLTQQGWQPPIPPEAWIVSPTINDQACPPEYNQPTPNRPRVHVLLAARNGEPYLREQVASILRQVNVAVRLTIRIDPSDDATLEVAERIAQENTAVTVIQNSSASGSAPANFLRLLSEDVDSDDDWVALSDQDDYWYPEKLERAVSQLQTSLADGYSSDVYAFWEDGHKQYIRKSRAQTAYDHLLSSPGPGCTFVLRGSLVRDFTSAIASLEMCSQEAPLHDWLIYAWARENGHTWIIDPVALMDYRQHANNVIGANKGLAAALNRLRKPSQKWYVSSVKTLSAVLDATTPPEKRTHLPLTRIGLIRRLLRLRRSLPESVVCVLLLIRPGSGSSENERRRPQ